MRFITDKTLDTQVLLFDSALDIIQCAKRADPKLKELKDNDVDWVGRSFRDYDDLQEMFHKPWEGEGGHHRVTQMIEAIRHDLPQPVNTRRSSVWSEERGEVDVQRAMRGESSFYRDVVRKSVTAPKSVTILCEIGGNAGIDSNALFWRGAGTIACVDLLEDAGYSCEVQIWHRTRDAYVSPRKVCNNYFLGCAIKGIDSPVDMETLINVTSGWFFRTAVFGTHYLGGTPHYNFGFAHHDIGEFGTKYMDLSGSKVILFPTVFDQLSAAKAAKQVLADVTNHGEER